ncbi:hypothetical protein MuYL_1666 [Mucilaginibacter xinganensis]|uniref:Uncharacterized protein n=1 Tax=Mucilaginibacter xinganensis TaxID=1234841 RepID=A0A223NUK4_9SPHI|nr:hypothetical protein MuYL_1666 [Mucilaginibacter xinganensis]
MPALKLFKTLAQRNAGSLRANLIAEKKVQKKDCFMYKIMVKCPIVTSVLYCNIFVI